VTSRSPVAGSGAGTRAQSAVGAEQTTHAVGISSPASCLAGIAPRRRVKFVSKQGSRLEGRLQARLPAPRRPKPAQGAGPRDPRGRGRPPYQHDFKSSESHAWTLGAFPHRPFGAATTNNPARAERTRAGSAATLRHPGESLSSPVYRRRVPAPAGRQIPATRGCRPVHLEGEVSAAAVLSPSSTRV